MPKFKEIIIQYVNVFDNTYVDLSGNTQPVQPLDIYLVPNEDKSHDRYVVDNEGVISKQSNGSQANYLRASGTDPFQQVSGYFDTRFASFHVYQNDYPYDSRFMLSPGNIELSSRVIAEDPTNRILIKEDGIRFTTKNLICDSIPNAQGDASYTRQLVQKNDGTLGYEFKSSGGSRPISYMALPGDFINDSMGDIVFLYKPPEGTIYDINHMGNNKNFRIRIKGGQNSGTLSLRCNTRISVLFAGGNDDGNSISAGSLINIESYFTYEISILNNFILAIIKL